MSAPREKLPGAGAWTSPKIAPPDASGALPRERLQARLDAARARPVIWLGAPAGFGKTTLAAGWLAARGIPAVWLTLDLRDAEPSAFLHFLHAAVARAAPPVAAALPPLLPGARPDLFARTYLEELYARLPRPFALVLDQIDEVGEDAPALDVVREAAAAAPGAGVTLVLLGRGALPRALARERARDRIAAIEAEDLRLTEEETAALVRARLEGAVPAGAGALAAGIRALHDATGGWAAALVLHLERARATGRLPDRPEPGGLGERALFDYLAAEVFARLAPGVQSLLLRIATVRAPGATLAAHLSGDPQAGEMLERLSRQGFFVRRAGAGPDATYELHPLLRSFLLDEASRRVPPDERARLRRAAAEALFALGRLEEALEPALEAPDPAAVARILRDLAPTLLAEGRHEALERSLGALPAEAFEADPWLAYWRGVCRTFRDPAAAAADLAACEERFRAAGDVAGSYIAWSDALAACYVAGRDWSALDPLLAKLETIRAAVPAGARPPALELQADALTYFVLALRRPGDPALDALRERALAFVRGAGDPSKRALAAAALCCFGAFVRAELAPAEEVLRALRADAPRTGPLFGTFCEYISALVAWVRGDTDAAARGIARVLELTRRTGVGAWEPLVRGLAVQVALVVGDDAEADRLLAALEPAAVGANLDHSSFVHFLRAWHALERGDVARAAHQQALAAEQVAALGKRLVEPIVAIEGAQVRFEQGDRAGARAALGRAMREAARRRDRMAEMVAWWTRAAFDLEERGPDAAAPALRRALAIARERGVGGFPLYRRRLAARLAALALDRGIEPVVTRGWIEKHRLLPEPPLGDLAEWPFAVRIRTLGGFALERAGEPLAGPGARGTKPLELIQALVAAGGERMPADRLADALWPDLDGHGARRALETTLYRARALLGAPETIVLEHGKLSIDPRRCWVDARALEQAAKALARAAREAHAGRRRAAEQIGERILALYRGPFLPEVGWVDWAIAARERLRAAFRTAIGGLAAAAEREGRVADAIAWYQRGLAADEVAESFYQGLIRCRLAAGQQSEALSVFERCRAALSQAALQPSALTRGLIEGVRAAR